MIGKFAASRAGHDKNRLYVITSCENGYVYLCDGKAKPLLKPKKKKEKHIQIINRTVDEDLLNRLRGGLPVRDEELRYEIRAYVNKRDKQPDEG